jgi:ABC-type protease/lipase transport system fused ATPase/permease subunit
LLVAQFEHKAGFKDVSWVYLFFNLLFLLKAVLRLLEVIKRDVLFTLENLGVHFTELEDF